MRLFVTGSIAGHRPGTGQRPRTEDKPLLQAATELGYEAARAGHVILLRNVTSRNAVDRYVLQGATKWCEQEYWNKATVESHLPDFFSLQADPTPRGLTITAVRYPRHGGSAAGDKALYFDWLVATVRAVDSCDVAITLGDGESVRMVGSLSASGSAPVLAIAAFGGSSRDVFAQHRSIYAMKELPGQPVISALSDRWQTGSAELVVAFAERLCRRRPTESRTRSYFISYSSNDAEIADHIELLLRRNDRRVLRDETFLRAGDRLPDAVAAMISQCGTFVVINSCSYARSDWCQNELALALDTIKPARVVCLITDDSSLPIRLANSLGIRASSRSERRFAVERLIDEELTPIGSSS